MVGNFIEVGIWQNLESALLTVYSIGEMSYNENRESSRRLENSTSTTRSPYPNLCSQSPIDYSRKIGSSKAAKSFS